MDSARAARHRLFYRFVSGRLRCPTITRELRSRRQIERMVTCVFRTRIWKLVYLGPLGQLYNLPAPTVIAMMPRSQI